MPESVLAIHTESGHIIKFSITPEVLVDLERDEDGQPFFSVAFNQEYMGVESTSTSLSLDEIRQKYKDANLLTSSMDYDHIQIGFIYSDDDPNNHRWMLNFVDHHNKFLFNHIADSIQIGCPFTTTSWEDGVWHGRFVVYKKDIAEMLEVTSGKFILKGSGNLGDHKVNEIKEEYDELSLAYSVKSNTWYCNYMLAGQVIGSIPCKNILCDVPGEGRVDRTSSKPKVTVTLKKKDIEGISVALNALIIKRKEP